MTKKKAESPPAPPEVQELPLNQPFPDDLNGDQPVTQELPEDINDDQPLNQPLPRDADEN